MPPCGSWSSSGASRAAGDAGTGGSSRRGHVADRAQLASISRRLPTCLDPSTPDHRLLAMLSEPGRRWRRDGAGDQGHRPSNQGRAAGVAGAGLPRRHGPGRGASFRDQRAAGRGRHGSTASIDENKVLCPTSMPCSTSSSSSATDRSRPWPESSSPSPRQSSSGYPTASPRLRHRTQEPASDSRAPSDDGPGRVPRCR